MPDPINPNEDNFNSYIMDSSDVQEMLRLQVQDQMFTHGMRGPFAEMTEDELSAIHTVLDVACGPGGWALEVARRFPWMQVTGVDISRRMIEYAQAQARAQGLTNVSFKVMDVLKKWSFPDRAFHVVNGRLLIGILTHATWSPFLRECLRVTKSKGIIRLTECELAFFNGRAALQMQLLMAQAMERSGQTYAPGAPQLGITTMLKGFLRELGLKRIDHRAHAIETSWGTEAYKSSYEDNQYLYTLMLPFLIKMGVGSREEIERLAEQALQEMREESWRALTYLLTAWGHKPRS
jgi:ubiquinone/menaquinone biosynthesis C-methylase UbiE